MLWSLTSSSQPTNFRYCNLELTWAYENKQKLGRRYLFALLNEVMVAPFLLNVDFQVRNFSEAFKSLNYINSSETYTLHGSYERLQQKQKREHKIKIK